MRCSLLEKKGRGKKLTEEFGLGILSLVLVIVVSFAMGTKLSQTLTTIIVFSLLLAAPFFSSAQFDEQPYLPPEYPFLFNFSQFPNPSESPNANDTQKDSYWKHPAAKNSQPSPPPPPGDSSNLRPPPPKYLNTTDEWVSSNTRELNSGKMVGLAFLAVAVVLQIVLGGFLMYKRRKIANL